MVNKMSNIDATYLIYSFDIEEVDSSLFVKLIKLVVHSLSLIFMHITMRPTPLRYCPLWEHKPILQE